MNCPNCGKPTRDGAAFCGECGHRLSELVPAPVRVAAPAEPAPLRRPPPPPLEDEVALVPPPQFTIPEVAPLVPEVAALHTDAAPALVPPPPPPGAPRAIEIVPFGTTEDVVSSEPAPANITISAPPGIGDPPPSTSESSVSLVRPLPESRPESLDETRVSVRRSAIAHWRLVLPDGRHIEVTGTLLVGRDPAANPSWPDARLLGIEAAGSLSKTHALFELDRDGLWVTDLDSTNGVVVTMADSTELDLDTNVRTPLEPGSDVELGDLVVQIEKD